jgi:hypothetical protein
MQLPGWRLVQALQLRLKGFFYRSEPFNQRLSAAMAMPTS